MAASDDMAAAAAELGRAAELPGENADVRFDMEIRALLDQELARRMVPRQAGRATRRSAD